MTLSGAVQERPLLSRESKTRLSDCGVVHEVGIDSERTKSKMLIFCIVLIFAHILTTFGISFMCWIDDKKSRFKRV